MYFKTLRENTATLDDAYIFFHLVSERNLDRVMKINFLKHKRVTYVSAVCVFLNYKNRPIELHECDRELQHAHRQEESLADERKQIKLHPKYDARITVGVAEPCILNQTHHTATALKYPF